MPGANVWFAGLLGKVQHDGAPVELGGGLNFTSPLSAELNPATQMIDVSVGGLEGVLPGVSPDDDGKLAYWLFGELRYADAVKTDGTDLELSDEASVTFGETYLALTRSGTVLSVGATGGDWTTMTFGAPSGFVFSFTGGFDATITPSGMFLDNLNLDIGTGALITGASPASVGKIRLSRPDEVWVRNEAGTADIRLLAVNASNNLVIGNEGATPGTTAPANILYDVAAGGFHQHRVNGAARSQLSNTLLSLTDVSVHLTAGQGVRIGSAGTTGDLRIRNAGPGILFDDAESGFRGALGLDATNVLWLGHNFSGATRPASVLIGVVSGGTIQARIDGTEELRISATTIDAQSNDVVTTGQYRGGAGTPSTNAVYNAGHGAGSGVTVLGQRNAANTADIPLVSTDGSNRLFIGSPSAGTTDLRLYGSGGTILFGGSSAQITITTALVQWGTTTARFNALRSTGVDWEHNSAPIFGHAAASTVRNLAIFSNAATNFQSGDRVIFLADRIAAPTGDPSGGGYLYSEAGALKWRGSSGTVTTIAPA